jgi:hypothetical protein
MLARLLYPHDDDVSEAKIDLWASELEGVGSVLRYQDDEGHELIMAVNWSEHQRIDKPSKSKLPEPSSEMLREVKARTREQSRKPREHSALDQGREGTKEGTKEGSSVLRTAQDQNSGEGKPPKPPPPDDKTWLFQNGLELTKASRSLMGKWLKNAGDNPTTVRRVIEEAVALQPAELIPWITKALETRLKGNGAHTPATDGKGNPPLPDGHPDLDVYADEAQFIRRVKIYRTMVTDQGHDPDLAWSRRWGGTFPGDHPAHNRKIVVELLGEGFLSERNR